MWYCPLTGNKGLRQSVSHQQLVHTCFSLLSLTLHGVRIMDGLRPPEPVDFKSSSLGSSWEKWKKQFEIYFQACELADKSKATQVAILLHTAGPEAQEIAATFTWNEGEDKQDYAQVLAKFTAYCEPRKNVVFERYQFWKRDQKRENPWTLG